MLFASLIEGLRNLDEKTVEFFIDNYSGLIKTFIRKKVHPNDVDDATQEFLFHILKTNLFEKFVGDDEKGFRAYLIKCALNFSFDWRQKEINHNSPLEVFDAANPSHIEAILQGDIIFEHFAENEIMQRLNKAVGLLDENYRIVIELKLLGYSNAEIARALDKPLGSVNSWYTRALHVLRESLKDLHTSGEDNGTKK